MMTSENNNAVKCRQVSKVFSQGELAVKALSDIDIDISAGEFLCLSGSSGSGKTTLLNMIGGLDVATKGEITVAGKRLDKMTMSELADLRLHHIGFVFQAYNLIPVLSARENVEFVMQLQGIEAEQRQQEMRWKYCNRWAWPGWKTVALQSCQAASSSE